MRAGLVVVITGGSSGIGRATARALAARAAHLVLVARHAPALEEAAEECRALGAASVFTVPADIRDGDAIANIGRETLARHERLDVWINNAAQLGFSRFDETPPEVFRQIIETNVAGHRQRRAHCDRDIPRARQRTSDQCRLDARPGH